MYKYAPTDFPIPPYSGTSSGMEFRKDINGLRAVAVLAVMLYHFGLPGFKGGFVGVDVFFVISGFLMTGIILKGMAQQSFSLSSFYLSRAKRIIPALAVLCAVLLVAGWFWIPPADYKQLGRHAASALGFISNFIFKNEDGYFDTFSQDKWLLHSWSLSLEWQFYLLYPLIVLFLCRKAANIRDRFKRIGLTLAGISLASFLLSAFITPFESAFAFYLLPTRIWELLAGGIVFLLAEKYTLQKSTATLTAFAGYILVFLSITLFSTDTLWPGYAAFVPVFGTALIIFARLPRTTLLDTTVLQKMGIWSYSIYLWHWPVMVALRHAGLELSPTADAFGLCASVALGAASFYLVETPLRRLKTFRTHPRLATAWGLAAVSVVLLCGFAVDKQKGLPERVRAEVRAIEAEVSQSKKGRPKQCAAGLKVFAAHDCQQDPPAFIVWGDSHSGPVFTTIEKAAQGARGRLYHMTCPPFSNAYLEAKKHSRHCPEFNDFVSDEIDAIPLHIPLFIVFRYSMYLHGFNEHPDLHIGLSYTDAASDSYDTYDESVNVYKERLKGSLCAMAEKGRPVFVLQPVPEIGIDVPRVLSRQLMFQGETSDINLLQSDYTQRQEIVQSILQEARADCGVQLLDPVPYLCKNGQCAGSENGVPLYTDDNHLSQTGSAKLLPLFIPTFNSTAAP